MSEKTISEKDALDNAIKIIEDLNQDQQTGACILNLPNGPKCVQLTPEQCATVKGTYVGGKCNN